MLFRSHLLFGIKGVEFDPDKTFSICTEFGIIKLLLNFISSSFQLLLSQGSILSPLRVFGDYLFGMMAGMRMLYGILKTNSGISI